MGMQDEAIDFKINPEHQDEIPEPLLRKIDLARQMVKAGDIKVPKKEF